MYLNRFFRYISCFKTIHRGFFLNINYSFIFIEILNVIILMCLFTYFYFIIIFNDFKILSPTV